MAGTNRGFNPNTFRDAIRFVYTMAAPPDPDRQVVFHFEGTTSWSHPEIDSDNVPFDPTARKTTTVTKPPIKVPCQVESAEDNGDDTPFGTVIATRIIITLLDEDYAKVEDCTFVVFDGDKYIRELIAAPIGLFNVGLHSIVFIAENDR
jgi:hypothetical protein